MSSKNQFLLAFILIALGVLFRTVFHLGDNIEFVTTSALLSGSFLSFYWALMVPLLIMAVSDLIIGNTLIFLFTWSAYLFIGVIGFIFLRSRKSRIKHIAKATFSGVVSSLIFYLWTNFGVWFLDSFGMYPDNLSGLFQSYIFGLPFLKMNLLGNLFFVPLSFSLFDLLLSFKFNIPTVDQFATQNDLTEGYTDTLVTNSSKRSINRKSFNLN